MKSFIFRSLIASAILAGTTNLHAAAITPGDVVIYRVGDGVGALGTTAAAVFLDEYTVLGTFVQSIPVPTSGASALTAVGNSTTEGTLSLSQNGAFFSFTGYRKDVGLASPAVDSITLTPRLVGTLSVGGVLDTSISLSSMAGSTAATAIRSATSVDGSAFWLSSAANISYMGTPGPATTSTLIDTRNSRQVRVNANTVYAGNGSTTIAAKVQSYGTLPTSATAATPIITLATTDAVQSFMAFNINNANPGNADTIYAINTVLSQLIKWSFNGTSWVSDGAVSSSAQNLTGVDNGGVVTLFMTSGTTLSTFTDASGFGGALSGVPTSVATAGANTAFRGVEILPAVPEPSTAALTGLGLLGLIFARRSRKQ